VEEAPGLPKIYTPDLPGGSNARWRTLFGDADKPDAFIAATSPLLAGLLASPTRGVEGRPAHALDTEARLAALETAGFDLASHELVIWNASWNAEGIRALYGTFSPIARLDDARKTAILDGVARIAEVDFGGRVDRTLRTSLYTARRPG
jgi:hypothetical protein